MVIQKLHDHWSVKSVTEGEWMPATVPGSVYTDLINNGKAPKDPYWRDHDKQFVHLIDDDFEYESVFDAEKEILKRDKVLLRCHGLDTLAELYLNGEKIGTANNQHRIWEYDVKSLLKETGNQLRILFPSCIQYITERQKEVELSYGMDGVAGSPHVRKAHSSFGWDWGARFPDAGIWRDIMLLGFDTARIDNVYIEQVHKENEVELLFTVETETLSREREVTYEIILTDPAGAQRRYADSPKKIRIQNPALWWPHGYGEPN